MTIGDYTVTLIEQVAIIGVLGLLLPGSAVVAFNRREESPSRPVKGSSVHGGTA